MLEFIRRYQLDRDEIRSLPMNTDRINKMLASEWWSNPYSINKGDKKGVYYAVNRNNLDEFGDPEIYHCPGLRSATSTIYRLICKQYPRYCKVNFEALNQTAKKFPRKYQKLVKDMLFELYEAEPAFDINCDLLTVSEVKDGYFYDSFESSSRDDDNGMIFAYIIHDGGSIYDSLSYNASGSSESCLTKYLEQSFKLEPVTGWATQLVLKKELVSPQQVWNQNNPSRVRDSDRAYTKDNPVISVRISPQNQEKLDNLRITGESNSELLNRLVRDFPDLVADDSPKRMRRN